MDCATSLSVAREYPAWGVSPKSDMASMNAICLVLSDKVVLRERGFVSMYEYYHIQRPGQDLWTILGEKSPPIRSYRYYQP
jgi:hypothetical protein